MQPDHRTLRTVSPENFQSALVFPTVMDESGLYPLYCDVKRGIDERKSRCTPDLGRLPPSVHRLLVLYKVLLEASWNVLGTLL